MLSSIKKYLLCAIFLEQVLHCRGFKVSSKWTNDICEWRLEAAAAPRYNVKQGYRESSWQPSKETAWAEEQRWAGSPRGDPPVVRRWENGQRGMETADNITLSRALLKQLSKGSQAAHSPLASRTVPSTTTVSCTKEPPVIQRDSIQNHLRCVGDCMSPVSTAPPGYWLV